MAIFEIEKDGQVYEVDAPDQATALSAFSNYQPPAKTEVPTQRGRAALSGVTAGFSDEIVGRGRQLVDNMFTTDVERQAAALEDQPVASNSYEMYRDNERDLLNAYREDRPLESAAVEIGAGVLPAILSRGKTATMPGGMLARMGKGAGIGAAAGYGYSDADNLEDTAGDIALGAALGGVADPAIAGLGKAGSYVINQIKRLGKKPTMAAVKELKRLAAQTGRTVDEIISDIDSGAVMAENKTLTATIRQMKGEGGEAADFIVEEVPKRATKTKRAAQAEINDALGVGKGTQNIFKGRKDADELLRLQENAEYQSAFNQSGEVTGRVKDLAEGIIQKNKKARAAVQEMYDIDDSVAPLFRELDNGAVEFYRAPTLQDTEIIRRAVRDQADEAYRAGRGAAGGAYKAADRSLKTAMDDSYPDLARARARASGRRKAQDAYDEGRKALGKDVDELAVQMKEMKPPELKAFRAGVATSVKNRNLRNKNSMAALSDPTRQTGAALQTAVPQQAEAGVARATRIAADAADMENKVMYNSMTAPQQQAAERMGAGTLAMAAKGEPRALVKVAMNFITKAAPDMDSKQQMEVARLLFETDPQVVKKALMTEEGMTALQQKISAIAGDLAAFQAPAQARSTEAQ